MNIDITPQQTYLEEFNPKDYYETYYDQKQGALVGEWTNFVLQNLHKTFTPGGVEGDTLIDIGAGPTIYHLLSACEVFNNIITSDFVEENRNELRKWLDKDPKALDWTEIIKYVCDLEGNRQSSGEKAEKVRSTVKQVLKCDALKSNPFEPVSLPPADCLISCLCLEVCCKDMETFCNVLKQFKNLIKPGGNVLLLSALNSSFYYVGKKLFGSLSMSKEALENAFKEAGYEIVKMLITPREDKSRQDLSVHDSYYLVHARKPKYL